MDLNGPFCYRHVNLSVVCCEMVLKFPRNRKETDTRPKETYESQTREGRLDEYCAYIKADETTAEDPRPREALLFTTTLQSTYVLLSPHNLRQSELYNDQYRLLALTFYLCSLLHQNEHWLKVDCNWELAQCQGLRPGVRVSQGLWRAVEMQSTWWKSRQQSVF